MIDATMLAAMREAIEELLPDTCHILEFTTTTDGEGGYTQAWGTASAGTSVPCRLDAMTSSVSKVVGGEAVMSGVLQDYSRYVISMVYDQDLTEANRISLNGNYYNVTSVNTDQSWIAVRRATVERV